MGGWQRRAHLAPALSAPPTLCIAIVASTGMCCVGMWPVTSRVVRTQVQLVGTVDVLHRKHDSLLRACNSYQKLK